MPVQSFVLNRPIVLVGMMGAGKTAIGSALAKRIGCEFLDSDHEIERAANMAIAEIFERDGEAFFRRREREVLARLLAGAPAILSTGGGAFMSQENRTLISQAGVSLWLKASLELLWSRVQHRDTRPLLQNDDPYGTLASIFEARQPIYALADMAVEARAEYEIGDMTRAVLEALLEAGHAEELAHG